MNIKWQDKISNNEVLERSNTSGMEAMIMAAQLRWSGHILRMEDYRFPKKILYGELKEGTRSRGSPKKRFKDNLKQNLKKCNRDLDRWETLAANRPLWHSAVTSGEISVRRTMTCWSRHKETKKEGPDISANSGSYLSIRVQYILKRLSFADRPVQPRESPQVITTLSIASSSKRRTTHHCNAILDGITKSNLNRLQCIHNFSQSHLFSAI